MTKDERKAVLHWCIHSLDTEPEKWRQTDVVFKYSIRHTDTNIRISTEGNFFSLCFVDTPDSGYVAHCETRPSINLAVQRWSKKTKPGNPAAILQTIFEYEKSKTKRS